MEKKLWLGLIALACIVLAFLLFGQGPGKIMKKVYSGTFALDPGYMIYKGGDFKSSDATQKIRYLVSSNIPVQIYVVPSKSDYQLINDGNDKFLDYPACRGINVLEYEMTCSISGRGGITISNDDQEKTATVSLDIYQEG